MNRTLDQVADFAKLMIESKDIDPVYPVLRALYEHMEWRRQSVEALHFTTHYLAFYNLASAWLWWNDMDDLPGGYSTPPYPTAIERRNLRPTGQFMRHWLSAQYELDNGGIFDRITAGWIMPPSSVTTEDDAWHNYEKFWDFAQTIYGNGRWAAFKWAELLKKVHHMPLAAPDIRAKYCSGPIEGLQMIYGYESKDWQVHNDTGDRLQDDLAKRGVNLDIEGTETIACNWASLQKGHYYVGHDWAELKGVLYSQIFIPASVPDKDKNLWWTVLRAAMPTQYFVHESIGVDKQRCKAFKETGKLLCR